MSTTPRRPTRSRPVRHRRCPPGGLYVWHYLGNGLGMFRFDLSGLPGGRLSQSQQERLRTALLPLDVVSLGLEITPLECRWQTVPRPDRDHAPDRAARQLAVAYETAVHDALAGPKIVVVERSPQPCLGLHCLAFDKGCEIQLPSLILRNEPAIASVLRSWQARARPGRLAGDLCLVGGSLYWNAGYATRQDELRRVAWRIANSFQTHLRTARHRPAVMVAPRWQQVG